MTLGSIQRADTLGQGNHQVAVEPGVLYTAASPGQYSVVPTTNVAVRYGVSERVDLGIRAGMAAYELSIKYQLTQPKTHRAAMLSVAATFGAVPFARSIYGWANVPLLIGIPIQQHQLVLGPRGIYHFAGKHDWLMVGTSVGFALQITPKVTLMPEITTVLPASLGNGWAGDSPFSTFSKPQAFTKFELGLLFGKAKKGVGPD